MARLVDKKGRRWVSSGLFLDLGWFAWWRFADDSEPEAREPETRKPETRIPVTFEYELDRFFVAGFQYHEGLKLIGGLRVGDDLTLVREPENPYDERAVALYREDKRIGYVPSKRNHVISRLLDQAAPLTCGITRVDGESASWETVEISISLPSAVI